MMKTLKKWSSAILVLLILCGVLLLTACDSDQDAVGNGGVDSATTQSVGGNGGEEIPTEPPTTEGGDSTQPLDPCIKGHTEVIDVAISATCTQPGKTEGKHCSVCGFVIVAQVEIPAGHTVVTDAAVAPTCTEKGKTEGSHCSVCNVVIVAQEEIPAGHTEVLDAAVPFTCTQPGKTEGKHCSVCGFVTLAQVEIPARHTEVLDAAIPYTCTKPGKTAGSHCSACGFVIVAQEEIPARHAVVIDAAVSPSCSSEGKTEGSHCSICGDVLVAQEILPAEKHYEIHHEAKAPTCSRVGWEAYVNCLYCTYTTKVEIPALQHAFVNGVCQNCTYTGISSAEELKNISMDGMYILLCDIDLGGMEWTPLGNFDAKFTGVFDGDGYVISNFKITNYSGYEIGLFGNVTGDIKNLGIENYTIDISSSQRTSLYAGALVGRLSGTVTDCYAIGQINCASLSTDSFSSVYAGGLAGANYGEIRNSFTQGTVSASTVSGGAHAGGLVGQNYNKTISNCYSTADVFATTSTDSTNGGGAAHAGGLIGDTYSSSSAGTVLSSYATGNVTAIANGGSAYAYGFAQYETCTDCYATGNVTATSGAGSASAYGFGSSGKTNCYATGNVSATTSSTDKKKSASALAFGSYSTKCYATGDATATSYGAAYVGVGCYALRQDDTSYWCNEQTFTASGPDKKVYTTGIAKDMATLLSTEFLTRTLGWDEAIWSFAEGENPTLKNAGVSIEFR